MLSYWYKMPGISWADSPPGFILWHQGTPFLRLEKDGSCPQPGAASPSDLVRLNAWIGEICRLRSAGEWRAMFERLSADRRDYPPPYDWLKRLCTAHALMGLSRYDEALAQKPGECAFPEPALVLVHSSSCGAEPPRRAR
jgi:hypothetical protein